jgi:hypothetical protein
MAAVFGFAGTTASAEPVLPQQPTPATVTQTVTVAPAAMAPQALGQQAQVQGVPGQAVAPAAVPGQAGPSLALAQASRPPETIVPATSLTLAEFFKEKNVTLEPQVSKDFKALNLVLPMPPGWNQIPDPNVPDAFAVTADRAGTNPMYSSNAQLLVYKLVGDFDPKEAISHGLIDTQQLAAWRGTVASLADFGGMPSSFIEGTYRENQMTLNTSRRHVIATSGPDRYLVSFSVNTAADEAVAAAQATDAVVNGFRVSVPGAAPPPAAAPAAPAAPVTLGQPQSLGLPQ